MESMVSDAGDLAFSFTDSLGDILEKKDIRLIRI